MRFSIIAILTLVAGIGLIVFFGPSGEVPTANNETNTATSSEQIGTGANEMPNREVVASNLEIPWGLAFLPDGDMLVTERSGRIVRIDEQGNKAQVAYDGLIAGSSESIPGVEHVGEGGLLGITLHPNFAENNLVYVYHTVRAEAGDNYLNRIVQYELIGNELRKGENTHDILVGDQIPGAPYHDGGRIKFGPDGKLYVTVGDATREDWAQIPDSEHSLQNFAGSILRLNPDGTIPADNPFGNAVYSYGHRNPQGITWDESGRMWGTEHGRSGVLSGLDEVNLIEAGGNYGWPDSQGDTVRSGTIAPAMHSGARTTWAPASAEYLPAEASAQAGWDGSIFFGGLRGEALYEAVLDGERVVEVREHFKGEFGRVRTVVLGPDGALYITTSNRDGRGSPHADDDKIIRLNPSQFR